MFEIRGTYETAICYATAIDDGAIEQIRAMCDQPFTEGAHVRIMPDAHKGAGCTIGTTMLVTDMAVPNVVGVDIGCGMYTVDIGKGEIDYQRLDEACHFVPSGFSVWDGRRERFDLTELRCHRQLKDTRRLERSLGTLGGGNHFIEVDEASDGRRYLVIHSGSRNLGLQVAHYYQRLAVELHEGRGDYLRRRDELIARYREQGRREEIQQALKEIAHVRKELDAPAELCWLYGSHLDDYLADVAVCQRFAARSREIMAEVVCERAGLRDADAFHTVHNYIDPDERILRKGSIAAHEGELVLIPLNMRDGSVLARGRGNEEWNFSAPHGAGRVLSRAEARDVLSLDEYQAQMEGVYTTSVSAATIDEAPDAYKAASDIMGPISEAVDVIEVLRPRYNFKAS